MSKRQEAAARTRERLLECGLQLAERTGLGALSVNLLVADAGVSKGTFFHHFQDRSTYLRALHQEFHERVLAEIDTAIKGMEPGSQRLLCAATTYLDTCLRHRGVRALLLEARAETGISEEVTSRNAANAALCRPDFKAMGWPHPTESARLWIGLTAEAAIVEHERGRQRPTIRAALAGFIDEDKTRRRSG